MIDAIIRFSIQHKLIVGLFVVVLLSVGIYCLRHLPIDAVPDITDNQVQVITSSHNLATQEVEQMITAPLELALANIPGVVELRSVSRFGLSVITVVFAERVDTYLARQLISERLQATRELLPPDVSGPDLGPITTGLGEIYQYVLYPKAGYETSYDPTQLRTLHDWVVRRRLMGLEGVIEVNSSGGYLQQFEVAIDPARLRSLNLDLLDVYDALADNNANTGGSYIEKGSTTYFIRGEGRLQTMDDIGAVLVTNRNGQPVRIRDVAEVRIGHAPRFGAVTMNGRGEVVAGQVMMLKGANAAEVTERVKARLEEVKAELPEGLVLEPYLDRSELVDRTIRTVTTNLVEGGLIVIFVLVLLLGNLRAGLVVASVIPLSMLFAISMMYLFGVSANLMSLGAIDFGLVVDGAVIIVESILHRLFATRAGQTLTQSERDAIAYEGASRIRTSAAFGEIIILIVYLPILLLIGIEGKMFRPMAQTVSFAILGAFILSLTYVPALTALILPKHVHPRTTLADRIMAVLRRVYQPVLKLALRWRYAVVAVTLFVLVLSLWRFNRLGGEFIPTLEEGDFALHQILPPGSSIEQSVAVSTDLQRMLLDSFPEVEKVVTKIGTAEIPTDIMPMEAGDIYVALRPKKEWETAQDREEMFQRMEAVMSELPGVMYEFTQPIQMRFNELMTGVRQDVAIKIYGDNLGVLRQKAQAAEGIIREVAGVGDVQTERVTGLPQLVIRYRRDQLARYGVAVETVNQVVKAAFGGATAGYILDGERRFELVVRLAPRFRHETGQVGELFVPLPDGGQIPLAELADIQLEEGPAQISRDNTQRRIVIGVNARNRDVESVVNDIRERLTADLDLPTGYYVSYGGQYQNLERARARFAVAVPAALALIFLLLYFTFGNLRHSLLVFAAIPLAAVGGVWSLVLRDLPFSISAGVGFIALFGVAVLNGIVLIAYFNRLAEEGVSDPRERVLQGTQVRLRPVVLTAAVASLGFLPMALSTSAGAEVQRPLATVVIGGLITATLLTLLLLPVLYEWIEQVYERRRVRKWGGTALLILGFCGLGVPSARAQTPAIGLDAVLERLETQPAVREALLREESLRQLEGTAGSLPGTQLYVSGEEWRPGTSLGVHSLGITQTLWWPGYAAARRRYLSQQTAVAGARLALQRRESARRLRRAYAQLRYTYQQLQLTERRLELYEQLRRKAAVRAEAGETSRAPLLAAETRRGRAELQREQAQREYGLAQNQLANWLGTDTLFAPADTLPTFLVDPAPTEHPAIAVERRQLRLAEKQLALVRQQYRPQWQLGGQLQAVNGVTPFFGFQIGISLPLFRTGQQAQRQSAELAVAAGQAAVAASERELAAAYQELAARRQQAFQRLQRLDNELLPLAREQLRLAEVAYRNGEYNFLTYADSVEQLLELEAERLQAYYELDQLAAELIFWTLN